MELLSREGVLVVFLFAARVELQRRSGDCIGHGLVTCNELSLSLSPHAALPWVTSVTTGSLKSEFLLPGTQGP
jgi:hypothetical protein